MTRYRAQLKTGALTGLKKAWSSFVWICQIVVPVSFLVALLNWTGWLSKLDFALNPLTGLINLPPEAALPIITGMLINIYAVIAVISVLPFTIEQMTLIAVFTLIAHNLILEGVIQHRSGINVVKATLIRLCVATATVLVVSQFLGDTSQSISLPAELTAQPPFLQVLKAWAVDTVVLLTKILGIIVVIMVILESLRALGWIAQSLRFFRPLMRILGLSDRTAMMSITAILFGLLYGGAVIVEETKEGTVAKEELERLHISIGINHGMVEDTALFALLGLNILWLLVPRLLMAIAVVQGYRAIRRIKARFAPGVSA